MEADVEDMLIWMNRCRKGTGGKGGAFDAPRNRSFDIWPSVGIEVEMGAAVQGSGPVGGVDRDDPVECGFDILGALHKNRYDL